MNNIAIIPARGGSKRIPRKNIREFLGKPILSYSIDVALKSGLFSEVMVSTDDEEIANIALEYGANVPFFRSKLNSKDTSTTLEVIEEVVNMYTDIDKYFDNICCIYPCAPFCTTMNLLNSYNLFIGKKFNTVFPVVQYSSPIQRALNLDNNIISMSYPEFQNTRSQDLEKKYFDAGQFYWINAKKTFEQKNIYTDYSGSIIIDELNAQDIDNEIDWQIAELKYKLINKNGD
jgi:pseudaminic acid cytidylyltransferase